MLKQYLKYFLYLNIYKLSYFLEKHTKNIRMYADKKKKEIEKEFKS